MSAKARSIVGRALRALAQAHAPEVVELVDALDASMRAREPIAAPPKRGPAEPVRPVERQELAGDEADTIIVEMTDASGRFVGYTTAEICRRSGK